jgi:hypothetical protein
MDMWDNLDAAEQSGELFRDRLSQTEGFNFTKWFDGVSRYVKPAVLAVAVASGATGCANMAQQALGKQHTPYQSMVAEAQELDAMPKSELRNIIEGRTHTNLFDHLERKTITELASQISQSPGMAVNLGGELALENPFVPGQLIQVSENDDWSANMTIAFEGGFGLANAIQTPFYESPHALNGNNNEGAVSSFTDPSKPSFIVLPDKMSVKWPSMMQDKEESVAFTLFHEAAHPHTLQEVALHLDQGDDTNKIKAHHNTYKILNENHADVTAAVAVFKEYDLTPEDFIRKLNDLKGYFDMTTEASGMNGSPNENFGPGMYRSQKAIDVLIEITERDPEFLKSMEYEEIPLLAFDVVRQAGYHHNAAELILDKRMESISAELANRDQSKENAFVGTLERTFPENKNLAQSINDLRQAQSDLVSRVTVEAYTSNLAANIMFKDQDLPHRSINEAMAATKKNPVDGFDVPTLIESHVAEVLKRTEPEKLFEHLESLQTKLSRVLQVMPDRETIQEARLDALADIRQELIELNLDARAADKSSVVATGSAEGDESIADKMIQKYGIDTSELPDRLELASQHSSPAL